LCRGRCEPGIEKPGGDEERAAYQKEAALADSDVLGELADGTGALFSKQQRFAGWIPEDLRGSEFMYVLGFSPQNLKIRRNYHA